MTRGSYDLSRREFLGAVNAAALLLLLESCSLGPVARKAAGPSVPPGSTAYEQSLKLLLDAVRASPDHLAQRATDLVGARDATRIVEFVRDRITAVPPLTYADDPRSGRTWGAAATLRGGQGTLRERADILADLLTRAGFKAQVLAADRPSGIGLAEMYRQRVTQFSPDQTRVELAKSLLRQAGAPAPPSAQPFAAGPDAASAILAALPAQLQKARLRDDLLPAKVPVVGFEDGGKTRYAYALGDLGVLDAAPPGLGSVVEADATRNVTITVSALTNPAQGSTAPRGKLVDLVTAHWPAEQVVGRQVLLTFAPPQGPKGILDSGLAALPVRVPVLRLQTGAPPVAGGASLFSAGPMITVQGDVLGSAPAGASPSPAGSVPGPYGPIQVLAAADQAAALARVGAIKGSVNGTAFPEVEVEVSVTDSSGSSVDGLSAASFTVKEQGAPVSGFAMYSNTAVQIRPRVLVVYDAAFVEMWPSAAAKSSFETGLAGSLGAAAARTPFDTQVVSLGAAPDPQAWSAPEAPAMTAALAAAHEAADDPWSTVGGPALDQGVVAIILVSDNDTTDTDPAKVPTLQRRLVGSKVPVFVVPVGQVNTSVTAQIVALSGGAQLGAADPGTPARLASLVLPYVSAWNVPAYRFRYQAPTSGPARRTVVVGLAGRAQPVATLTYSVPAQPLPPPAFAGLYARIDLGPVSSFRRLAGIEATPDGFPLGALDDPVAVAETRAAVDGITTIAVEPGSPTTAALLDDMISSCLSFEPLRPIWGTATNDQLLSAVPGGVHRFPGILASMMFPSSGDPALLPALKVAILQERAFKGSGLVELHGDLAVAANPVTAITTDAAAGFKAAVRSSVAANVVEASAFGDSAYQRLSGRKLSALAYGDYAGWAAFLKTVPAEKLDAWKAMSRVYADFHVLVADAGAGDALWVVDRASGASKAVLLDGTGGGLVQTGCSFSGYDYLAITLAMLAIICGAGGAEIFPLYCVGINAAAAVMAAASYFNGKADTGTPFGLALGIFNPLGPGLSTAVGIMLLMITYQQAGCY